MHNIYGRVVSRAYRKSLEEYRESGQIRGPISGLTLEQLRHAEEEGDLPSWRPALDSFLNQSTQAGLPKLPVASFPSS